MKKALITILICLLGGCSSGEFSGDSGSNVQKKPIKKPPPSTPTPLNPEKPTGPSDPNGLNPDNGGKTNICDPNAMVEDANASEQIPSRHAVVNVIVAICKSKPLTNNYDGAGAAHNDQLTANAVCRFKGYKSGTITQSGKYYSCGDNFIGKWEGPDVSTVVDFKQISGSIRAYGACTSNSTIDGLSCKGKLRAACVPKVQDIQCN